jgi:large subunit ribosomal protein L7/L12
MAKLTVADIIESLKEMTMLEISDLTKAIQDEFGVQPMMAAAAVAAPAAAEAVEEKTQFDVILTSFGAEKIKVIKVVRELVSSLSLGDAKALVEAAPKAVLTGVSKEDAAAAKAKLEEVGAAVEVK